LTDGNARADHHAGMTGRGEWLDRLVSRLIVLSALAVLLALVWWGSSPR
jgi:hypothetical protein